MSYPDTTVVSGQWEAAQRAIDRLHTETERLRALLEYQALTDKTKPSCGDAAEADFEIVYPR